MPWYKATKEGFDGSRRRPGDVFFSEAKLDKSEWCEKYKAPADAEPPKKRAAKKGPAVAEGAEGVIGAAPVVESSSEVEVI